MNWSSKGALFSPATAPVLCAVHGGEAAHARLHCASSRACGAYMLMHLQRVHVCVCVCVCVCAQILFFIMSSKKQKKKKKKSE